MATHGGSPSHHFQPIDFDQKLEERAVKHRTHWDRNNVTTCRSPTRDLDTRWVKNELHRKRQQEFSKRRPADCGFAALLSARTRRNFVREEEYVTQTTTSFSRHFTARRSTNSIKQAMYTSTMNDENGPGLKQEGVAGVLDSLRQRGKAKKERILLRDITQFTNIQRTLHTASAQTESGIAAVKEADVQQLAEYLEEALYREEALKKKLVTLQRSASTLLRSTELLWKTRCDEDVLKSKIKALEAQLQLCMKRVPQDGVKKVIFQMEKQKEEYERKALEAIQRATEEKSEAQSQTQSLQEALQTAQEESLRWQKLCEELRQSSSLLRNSQDQCTDQLLHLQNQLERSRQQEESLKEQCEVLQQNEETLRSNISLLEEDNQSLRDQLEELTDHSHGSWNNVTEVHKQGRVLDQLLRTDNSLAEQLRQAELRLSLKEKECVDLKAELEALEQECYSYQSRLTQFREELNTLTTQKSKSRTKRHCCGSFICLTLFLLMMMVAVMAAVWIYHPPIRDQLCDFYSFVEERVEDYLMQVASAQHAVCFKPI
ncbi:TRAF3-interacting JNK-activating modulator-like isoform X1 [Astyanax mexicanus]|uniref:TRAF3-interacting JNK-activating modulator-like isoform X1 n=1 Tax=Astyanax mexicanus TaxID=7994 RepID=A0A8T2LMZ1_ASTMX|nr:TRAF3-interacting JNK-activating modulator-like isoform X1 [Astyanax mexicanus]